MDVLYLLVPLSVILVFAFAAFFWWALDKNQFDDLDAVSEHLLADADGKDDAKRVEGDALCNKTEEHR